MIHDVCKRHEIQIKETIFLEDDYPCMWKDIKFESTRNCIVTDDFPYAWKTSNLNQRHIILGWLATHLIQPQIWIKDIVSQDRWFFAHVKRHQIQIKKAYPKDDFPCMWKDIKFESRNCLHWDDLTCPRNDLSFKSRNVPPSDDSPCMWKDIRFKFRKLCPRDALPWAWNDLKFNSKKSYSRDILKRFELKFQHVWEKNNHSFITSKPIHATIGIFSKGSKTNGRVIISMKEGRYFNACWFSCRERTYGILEIKVSLRVRKPTIV